MMVVGMGGISSSLCAKHVTWGNPGHRFITALSPLSPYLTWVGGERIVTGLSHACMVVVNEEGGNG